MNTPLYLLLIIAGYLPGSVPFSFLVARARGVDLRTTGSGNVGSSNVWRTCGFGPFLVAASCDVLKGMLPVLVALRLGITPALALLVGAAAILGHTFPVFLGFRGGKAVATSGGVLLALAPILVLAGIATWAMVFWLSRIAAVASLSAAAVVVALASWLYASGQLAPAYTLFVWLTATLIVYLHRSNIQRLRNGTENRFEQLSK